MQDKNPIFNPNQLAQTPEKTVRQFRQEVLERALLFSDRAYNVIAPPIAKNQIITAPFSQEEYFKSKANNVAQNIGSTAYSTPPPVFVEPKEQVPNNAVDSQRRFADIQNNIQAAYKEPVAPPIYQEPVFTPQPLVAEVQQPTTDFQDIQDRITAAHASGVPITDDERYPKDVILFERPLQVSPKPEKSLSELFRDGQNQGGKNVT